MSTALSVVSGINPIATQRPLVSSLISQMMPEALESQRTKEKDAYDREQTKRAVEEKIRATEEAKRTAEEEARVWAEQAPARAAEKARLEHLAAVSLAARTTRHQMCLASPHGGAGAETPAEEKTVQERLTRKRKPKEAATPTPQQKALQRAASSFSSSPAGQRARIGAPTTMPGMDSASAQARHLLALVGGQDPPSRPALLMAPRNINFSANVIPQQPGVLPSRRLAEQMGLPSQPPSYRDSCRHKWEELAATALPASGLLPARTQAAALMAARMRMRAHNSQAGGIVRSTIQERITCAPRPATYGGLSISGGSSARIAPFSNPPQSPPLSPPETAALASAWSAGAKPISAAVLPPSARRAAVTRSLKERPNMKSLTIAQRVAAQVQKAIDEQKAAEQRAKEMQERAEALDNWREPESPPAAAGARPRSGRAPSHTQATGAAAAPSWAAGTSAAPRPRGLKEGITAVQFTSARILPRSPFKIRVPASSIPQTAKRPLMSLP